MAWTGKQKRTSQGVNSSVSILAGGHREKLTGGATFDATTVAADSNGDKIIRAGAIVAQVQSTGKWRVYSNTLADTAGGKAMGVLLEEINLKDGDVITGEVLIHGNVWAARLSGLDGNARSDFGSRIFFQG